jgi:hypothetical protein
MRQEVEQVIALYINDFYNPEKFHSAFQLKSYLEHEKKKFSR